MKREGSPAGVSLRLGRRREPVWDGKGGNAPPQRGSICREEGRALKACSVGFDSVGILFLFCAFVVDCSLSKPLSYAATLRSAGCSESKAQQTTGRPTKPDARQLVPVCLLACLLRVFPVVFIAGVSHLPHRLEVVCFVRVCVCVRVVCVRFPCGARSCTTLGCASGWLWWDEEDRRKEGWAGGTQRDVFVLIRVAGDRGDDDA